jgi:hypothetical protein
LSVPPAAVTVIPVDGSAVLSPPPGVIVTAGPVGDGLAFAAAPAEEVGLLPPYFTTVVVLVQAASASASAAAPAKAEPIRICLMSELFPTRQAQNATPTIHPG